MRVWIFPLLGLLVGFALPAAADTFRWQDANGQTHYGDEPPEDAQQLRRVKTYECNTDQCKAEMEQRYEEAVAANKALDEWLRERDAVRQAQQKSAVETRTSSIVIAPPLIVPTVPTLGPLIDDPFIGSLPKLKRPHHHHEPKVRRTRARYAR